jgi:hypothetical protein
MDKKYRFAVPAKRQPKKLFRGLIAENAVKG